MDGHSGLFAGPAGKLFLRTARCPQRAAHSHALQSMNPETNEALAAAVRLHDFIRTHAGETADWPLQITSGDPAVLARLDALLRAFRAALLATDLAI